METTKSKPYLLKALLVVMTLMIAATLAACGTNRTQGKDTTAPKKEDAGVTESATQSTSQDTTTDSAANATQGDSEIRIKYSSLLNRPKITAQTDDTVTLSWEDVSEDILTISVDSVTVNGHVYSGDELFTTDGAYFTSTDDDNKEPYPLVMLYKGDSGSLTLHAPEKIDTALIRCTEIESTARPSGGYSKADYPGNRIELER